MSPQPLEPDRREFGVAYCVPDVLVAEVGLDSPGVGAIVGEFVPAGMSQHVGVCLEAELGGRGLAGRG